MKTLYKNFFKSDLSQNPILKVLSEIPIFKNLSSKELKGIANLVHERTYKKDEPVFKKLAPAEGMYVIIEGKVEISDPDSGITFVTLGSGDFFGELALLDEEPRSAMAVAIEPSKLVGFFRTDLLTLMNRDPKIGNKILFDLSCVLGERLRRTNQELAKSQ